MKAIRKPVFFSNVLSSPFVFYRLINLKYKINKSACPRIAYAPSVSVVKVLEALVEESLEYSKVQSSSAEASGRLEGVLKDFHRLALAWLSSSNARHTCSTAVTPAPFGVKAKLRAFLASLVHFAKK